MSRPLRPDEYQRLIAKAEERAAKARVKARQQSKNSRPKRMAPINALLQKTTDSWAFGSERALENFVYDNLEVLLGLVPLKRQYNLTGEICDILAIAPSRQLVILELKNTEDRSIVQQITRYYRAIREAQPFAEQVDYGQPIRLMAIAPSFHRHNWIDHEHSTLAFEFCQFEIVRGRTIGLSFQLHNHTTNQHHALPISHDPADVYDISDYLPDPPSTLNTLLRKVAKEEGDRLLVIRHQILSFDERIKEIVASPGVKYGKGQTRCAEIRPGKHSEPIDLWLYLPIPNRRPSRPIDQRDHAGFRHPIGRMNFLSLDFKTPLLILYIPPGKQISQGTYTAKDFARFFEQAAIPLESEITIPDLVKLALVFWQDKVS